MNQSYIVSKIHDFLQLQTNALATWLGIIYSCVSNNWWEECVLNNLNTQQLTRVNSEGTTSLFEFDLVTLLRIADKSWFDLNNVIYISQSERECLRKMFKVQNNWAYCAGSIPGKD